MTAISKLPGWTFTDLGSLGRWGSGGTPNRSTSAYYEGGDIPWLVIGDLNERVVIRAQSAITKLGLESSSAKLLPPGTLLVAMYGSIGKTAVTGVACATNQAIAYCIPHPGVDLRYLHRAVQWIKPTLIAQGQGGAQQNISQGILKAQTVPLAPEREQKRIADKLDTVLTRVDAVNIRLARVAPILKRFRQSVLAAAISGRLTEDWRAGEVNLESADRLVEALANDHELGGGHARGNASEPTKEAHDLQANDIPKSWRISTLRDCCKPGRPITYGILKPGPELDEGVLYIRVADFPGNQLRISGIKKTSPEIDLLFKRARLSEGDLLLSIRGSVGRLIEIPAELEGANITQDTARLSINPRLLARYVYFVLLAPSTQRRMANAVRGVAVRGINIGDVRALQVPVPEIAEQTEIVRRVETLFAFADRLEARLQTAQTATERLTPSLLAKAFRGELVPQDPTDEPAGELLKRLAASASAAPPKRGHRQATGASA